MNASSPLPFRPAVWPVFVAYVVSFLLVLFASIALVLGVAALQTRGEGPAALSAAALKFALSPYGILSAAVVSEGTFLGVAVVTAALLGRDLRAQLRVGPSRATPVGFAAAIVGTVALSLAAGAATELLPFRPPGGTMEQIASSLAHASAPLFVLAVVILGVAPGIAEETFFRGFMQTRLAARLGRWPGIVIAASLFGLVHLDPLQSPLAFLLGLYLGWGAERLGSIRPSVVAHAANNALFVAVACVRDGAGVEKNAREDAALVAGAGVVFILCAVTMHSRFAVRDPAP